MIEEYNLILDDKRLRAILLAMRFLRTYHHSICYVKNSAHVFASTAQVKYLLVFNPSYKHIILLIL